MPTPDWLAVITFETSSGTQLQALVTAGLAHVLGAATCSTRQLASPVAASIKAH